MYKSKAFGEGGINAKVVADSIANDVRLTTLELCYPRFIHAEFMTHRMFSRNASSSRAIPVEKMIANSTAEPIHWGKNQAGMQAREELSGVDLRRAKHEWTGARSHAVGHAHAFTDMGAHKQVVNRLTEPFQFINVVVTATEWDNFFKLRLHKDAQPEIQELAKVMKEAMERSKPDTLSEDQWHTPYVNDLIMWNSENEPPYLLKASVARCARVSYLTHNNEEPTLAKDVELYNRLYSSEHMSPFEHVATPMRAWDCNPLQRWLVDWPKGLTHMDRDGVGWSNNFQGWFQYRSMLS